MHSADLSTVGRVLPARIRSALSVILLVVVVIGALVPWLGIAEAWRLAGDPMMYPEPGQDISRWLFVAGLMSYGLLEAGGGVAPIAMTAAAGVLAISADVGSSSDAGSIDRNVGRWRTSDLTTAVVLLASAIAALAALVRVLLVGYAWTSTPEELIGTFFAVSSGVSQAISVLAPAAEVLGWCAVLLLGVAWWRRADGSSPGDELDVEDAGSHDDPGEEVSMEEAPVRPPGVARERVDPARLRPDGSSDSGFDEFHFRR